MKKAISLGLALLMILPLFAGCSESEVNEPANDTKNTEVSEAEVPEELTAEEKEVSKADVKDNLPDDLDFGGTTINVSYYGQQTVRDFDTVGDLTGDVVLDSVFNRNITVEDRLKVKLNWVEGLSDYEQFPKSVETEIMAGSSEYDFIVEESCYLFKQTMSGYYRDILKVNYIDLSQPWWYSKLMEDTQFNNNARFFAMGDICPTALMGASAMFFNKPLFTDYFQDVNKLYDAVIEGTWTHDVFADYCRQVYTDVNGNGAADADDVMGFRFDTWAVPNYMSMSTGLTYTKRDEEGYPVLDIYTEDGIKWGETIYMLFYTDNISMDGDPDGTFAKQKSLFLPRALRSANGLRNLDFEYGILPYPKLYETLDYLSGASVVNGTGIGIPVTAPEDKLDATCATLEALCAESYRRVIPAWFDTALKIKYADATIDAQMVDIIYDHINAPFIIMADKIFNTGSIFANAMHGATNNGAFASWYASKDKLYTKTMEKAIKTYKELIESD